MVGGGVGSVSCRELLQGRGVGRARRGQHGSCSMLVTRDEVRQRLGRLLGFDARRCSHVRRSLVARPVSLGEGLRLRLRLRRSAAVGQGLCLRHLLR